MCNRKNSFGFTLIELVIVIIVLGILAVTITPRVITIVQESKEANTENVIGQVQAVIGSWQSTQYTKKMVNVSYMLTGSYPEAGGGVSTKCGDNPPIINECFPTLETMAMLVTDRTTSVTGLLELPINPFLTTNDVNVTDQAPCHNDGNRNHGWYYNATTGKFWANNYQVDGMTDVWCMQRWGADPQ